MLYQDPYEHVRISLWARSTVTHGWVSAEKFHEASRAEIAVRRTIDGRTWHDATLNLNRGDATPEEFEAHVRQAVELCGASFQAGQRARSRQFSALLDA